MVRLTTVRKIVRSSLVTLITSVTDLPLDDPTRSGLSARSQSTRYALSEKAKEVEPQSIGLKSDPTAGPDRTASAASDTMKISRMSALIDGPCGPTPQCLRCTARYDGSRRYPSPALLWRASAAPSISGRMHAA